MRSAKLILAAHTAMFLVFLAASLGGSAFAIWRPDLLPGLWLAGTFGVLGAVMAWLFWRWGDCPLTIWEKEALIREGHTTYEGMCLPHYLREWFGISLSKSVGNSITRSLGAAPIIAGIARWYFG